MDVWAQHNSGGLRCLDLQSRLRMESVQNSIAHDERMNRITSNWRDTVCASAIREGCEKHQRALDHFGEDRAFRDYQAGMHRHREANSMEHCAQLHTRLDAIQQRWDSQQAAAHNASAVRRIQFTHELEQDRTERDLVLARLRAKGALEDTCVTRAHQERRMSEVERARELESGLDDSRGRNRLQQAELAEERIKTMEAEHAMRMRALDMQFGPPNQGFYIPHGEPQLVHWYMRAKGPQRELKKSTILGALQADQEFCMLLGIRMGAASDVPAKSDFKDEEVSLDQFLQFCGQLREFWTDSRVEENVNYQDIIDVDSKPKFS